MNDMDYARFRELLGERKREERGRRLERGPWLNYTTHQVACPVGAWNSRDKDALCTCGYTLLVDAAIAAGAE